MSVRSNRAIDADVLSASFAGLLREGRRVITHTGQLFAGIAFFVAFLGIGIMYAVAF